MQKITVVGSTNVDLIMQVSHLPEAGETIGNGVFTQALGGKGANQALAASRLGGQVSFVSVVGEDDFGRHAIQQLGNERIDVQLMSAKSNIATGTALIFVDQAGENSIGVAPGANALLNGDYVEQHRSAIEQAHFVLMQLEIPMSSVQRVLEIAALSSTKVILNAAPMDTDIEPHLALIDTLIVNQPEALQLFEKISEHEQGLSNESITDSTEHLDHAQLGQIAKVISDCGVSNLIVTLGGRGVYISTSDYRALVPGFAVDVVDTTGAGDTFCGALAAELANTNPLEQAVEFAQRAAAIAVTSLGAQAAIPTKAQVSEFFRIQV